MPFSQAPSGQLDFAVQSRVQSDEYESSSPPQPEDFLPNMSPSLKVDRVHGLESRPGSTENESADRALQLLVPLFPRTPFWDEGFAVSRRNRLQRRYEA
ncbi:MAG: hypothetical protein LC750_12725 [Actinobacteria bacterium]|nr:hypothetical protein [Actinomycetota bacterium]